MFIKPAVIALSLCLALTTPASAVTARNSPTGTILVFDAQNNDSDAIKETKQQYLLALDQLHDPDHQQEGVRTLEKLADNNILNAKYALYAASKWVYIKRLTEKKLLGYLTQSAEGGLAQAQAHLAKEYMKGAFGKKDPETSFYWLKKSAEQGYDDAMAFTAIHYFRGIGTPKDDAQGFKWVMKLYHKSEKDFNGWHMLGQVYEMGRGTPVDMAKAYMCYDLLGTAGIKEKDRIAAKMTPTQITEGLRLSEEWQQQHHIYTFQSLGLSRQHDGSYQ